MKLVHVLLIGAVLTLPAAFAAETARSRQEQVAQKGALVMPFDLRRTTHFFDDNATGGVETITANSAQDARQIALVRSHLASEARRFAQGDFSDPAKIHGHDMPGLATLASAGGKLQVIYREVPGGASVTYSSDDRAVIAAVHDWFAAQRFDHAAHAHLHHAHDMHEMHQMHHVQP